MVDVRRRGFGNSNTNIFGYSGYRKGFGGGFNTKGSTSTNKVFNVKTVFSLSWKVVLILYVLFLSIHVISQISTPKKQNIRQGSTKEQEDQLKQQQQQRQQQEESPPTPRLKENSNTTYEIILDEKENDKAGGENDLREEYKEEVIAEEIKPEDGGEEDGEDKKPDEVVAAELEGGTTPKTDVQDLVDGTGETVEEEDNETPKAVDYREEVIDATVGDGATKDEGNEEEKEDGEDSNEKGEEEEEEGDTNKEEKNDDEANGGDNNNENGEEEGDANKEDQNDDKVDGGDNNNENGEEVENEGDTKKEEKNDDKVDGDTNNEYGEEGDEGDTKKEENNDDKSAGGDITNENGEEGGEEGVIKKDKNDDEADAGDNNNENGDEGGDEGDTKKEDKNDDEAGGEDNNNKKVEEGDAKNEDKSDDESGGGDNNNAKGEEGGDEENGDSGSNNNNNKGEEGEEPDEEGEGDGGSDTNIDSEGKDTENNENTEGNDDQGKKKGNVDVAGTDDIIGAIEVNDKGVQEVLNKLGTGPTQLGYVLDLVNERYHASFRNQTRLLLQDQINKEAKVKEYMKTSTKDGSIDLLSCEYEKNQKLYQRSECIVNKGDARTKNKALYAYNAAPFHRALSTCRAFIRTDKDEEESQYTIVIPPSGIVKLGTISLSSQSTVATSSRTTCLNQPPRYFHHSHLPDTDDDASIIVTPVPLDATSKTLEKYDLQPIKHCGVTCKVAKSVIDDYSSNLPHAPVHKLFVAGTNWKIIRSMKNPYDDSHSRIERTAFRNDVFYSTTSFQSSVPLSFYDHRFGEKYLVNTSALDWSKAANKGTYLLDHDCNAYKRNKWFAAIDRLLPVEAYGSCQKNAKLRGEETIKTVAGRIALQKKNRMVLVFDNGNSKDHLTAQIWEALASGAVPIIHGALNAAKHLPLASSGKPSAIYTSDFNTWDRLAEFVATVSNNQTLWESFHDWRSDENAVNDFFAKYEFTSTSPDCRLCMWAYAKKFGLGWDHSQQIIKDTNIARTLCLRTDTDDTVVESGSVIHPFIETWVLTGSSITKSDAEKLKDKGVCHHSYSNAQGHAMSVRSMSSAKILRRVFYHDGVTDMYVDSRKGTKPWEQVTLRLQFNVKNIEGGYFPNPHTLVESNRGPIVSSISIQDRFSKVTILANWVTTIHSPIDGIVEIQLGDNRPSSLLNKDDDNDNEVAKRIRVITEDLNEIHDKVTEFYPSHFGKIMMKDFIDPIDYFVSSSDTGDEGGNGDADDR